MPDAKWIALGLLLPCLLAAGVLLLLGKWWRAPRGRVGLAWMLAIALGYIAGHLAVEGLPYLQAMDVSGWIAFVFLPAALIILSLSLFRGIPPWLVIALEICLSCGLVSLMIPNSTYHRWTGEAIAEAIAGIGLAVTLTLWCVSALARRAPGSWFPFAMTGVVFLAGFVLFSDSGSFSCGMRCLSLAAALLGAAIASLWLPTRVALAGGMTLAAFTLVGLTLEGLFYASLKPGYAGAMILALWLGWVVELPPLRRLKPWQRGLIRAALMMVPLAIAAGFAGVELVRMINSPDE